MKSHDYARGHMRSRDYGVELNFGDGEGEGFFYCGMHNGGDFTISSALIAEIEAKELMG